MSMSHSATGNGGFLRGLTGRSSLRPSNRKVLADITYKNTQIAGELIETIRELDAKGSSPDKIDRLVKITRDLLDNNKELQNTVSKVLSDD